MRRKLQARELVHKLVLHTGRTQGDTKGGIRAVCGLAGTERHRVAPTLSETDSVHLQAA
jgi:hypothetical protein